MLPLLLLSQIAVAIAAPAVGCDLKKVAIAGGNYTLSDEGNIGSKVQYSCPKGMYPHPAYSRECSYNGYWTNGKEQAVCKAVQCPRPEMFEHGTFEPPQSRYFVGDVLSFECWDGFQRFGPENRTCQENGKWSGENAICDDQEGHCPNPGIPIGTTKVGSSYKIENRVIYNCQSGLKMFGSKERECMENKRWSGAEPSCRQWYTYDTPEEVSKSFSSSLSETIESSDPDKTEKQSDRKVKIIKGGLMNIFIIIDASKSVGPKNFDIAKASSEVFIEKVSSFDFEPRYAVISYATVAKPIVRLSEEESLQPDQVIEKIKNFKYTAHADKLGTNTRGALSEVHNMLSLENLRNPQFLETRNVIVLMTDGKHNMGGDPTVEIKRIRELLNIRKDNDREGYLDIYVFGLSDDVSETEINDIASKKDSEKHVFKMESVEDMKESFDKIIDEVEAFQMCGLSKEPSDIEDIEEKYPWIAKIVINRFKAAESCKGSIVSRNFILTAAHCFYLNDELHQISVDIGDIKQKVTVKNLYRHNKYDPAGKKDKNINNSFDYDLALLELDIKIDFNTKVRPICLPCTTGTSWALKQRGKSVSCSDHKNTLFSQDLVKAMFIAEEEKRKLEQKNVIIKRGNKRTACLEDAKKVKDFENVADIKDVVTDNFLCTGGIEPQVDPQTCKGDSGGPLIVPFKNRYIQVGVISWGTVNSCIGSKRHPGPVPAESRDFYTNLLNMMDWVKEVVKEDLEFLI